METNSENNKLIMQFMGYELDHLNFTCIPEFGIKCNTSSAKYDKSWDWLMTVVEKIEEEYDIQIDGDVCTVYCSQNSIKEIIIVGDSKIDATYKAVVEFIKWYNENN